MYKVKTCNVQLVAKGHDCTCVDEHSIKFTVGSANTIALFTTIISGNSSPSQESVTPPYIEYSLFGENYYEKWEPEWQEEYEMPLGIKMNGYLFGPVEINSGNSLHLRGKNLNNSEIGEILKYNGENKFVSFFIFGNDDSYVTCQGDMMYLYDYDYEQSPEPFNLNTDQFFFNFMS